MKRGALNVIPTDHGDVFRHAPARFAKRFDGAHGGDVVERKQRRELRATCKQVPGDPMAYFGRWGIAVELNREFFININSEFPGHRQDRLPACLRVRTEILSLDQSDSPVPQAVQIFEREVRAEIVVQNDVRDALNVTMAGDRDRRNFAIAAVHGVHGDDPFRGALAEKMRILIDQVLAVTMADHKIKVAFLEEMIFHAG